MVRLSLIVLLLSLCAIGVYSSLPVDKQGNFKSKIAVVLDNELLDNELGDVYSNLAISLKDAGHEVTIILTNQIDDVTNFQSVGINVQFIPHIKFHTEGTNSYTWKVYEVYEYLKTQQYDIVHVPDYKGLAYYSVLAKHQGLAFHHTLFVVGVHAPYIWSKISNFEHIKNTEPLELDFMQKQSVELADIVVSSSEFMLDWMKENGWTVPSKSYVQPNLISSRIPRPPKAGEKVTPREIVFYGHLMPCQGLILFCDALDKLSLEFKEYIPEDLKVTFLGSSGSVQGIDAVDYINLRSKRWSFPTTILNDKDHFASLRYLAVSPRLAVIAPEQTNTPLRVQELLHAGLPFIASGIGGIPELIAPESREEVLFAPREDKLALHILSAVVDGITPAKPAVTLENNKMQWRQWYSTLRAGVWVDTPETHPLVSVCITHFNRPEYVRQAVASIEAQSYSNIEVVLVDDASTSQEAREEIDNLHSLFEQRGWKVVLLEENSYLGKARNVAVQNAKGKYILFLDDDNVARVNEVATFVKAAERSKADLYTSVQDFFYGDEPPTEDTKPTARRVPLGGDAATGFFWNCFGDANSFIRKDSFEKIGGFTEDYNVGYEDYEFFAKAVLKGLKLEVVPEPLFWYRRSYDTMSFSTPLFKNRMRYLRSYQQNLPASLSNLFLLAHSISYGDEPPFFGSKAAGECSSQTNCTACVQTSGCGWCPANGNCVEGNASFAYSGNCSMSTENAMANGWSYDNVTLCVDCAAQTGCDSCAGVAHCGWCEQNDMCYQGDNNGAYLIGSPCRGSPDGFDVVTDNCPSSSSDKKKIAIIVGVTVAGGLILIAAIATGIFCIWHRHNRRRGYTAINQG